jgi:hypothetical protein
VMPRPKTPAIRKPPRIPKEEFARRGENIFQREIEPALSGRDPRHFVAIDIKSGAYEVDPDEEAATDRLLERVPNAYIWLRKVGSPYARHFGGRGRWAKRS